MHIIKTKLPSILILEPKLHKDSRGGFMELYSERRYHEAGISENFVQDNLSISAQGVVRGLHYQLKHPQGKLVTVLRGKVFDVVVDIRQGSPCFGQWLGFELSDENNRQLYIPPGFAHGYCTLSSETIFCYKCTDYYHPKDEYGILWSDPELDISWPLSKQQPIVSTKDGDYPLLRQVAQERLPEYR